MRPVTQYAKGADGVHIAYQVAGDGPFDLVFVPGWINHLDLYWELPQAARFFERLAAFSRLIIFDKRGTGLSDRQADIAWLEQRVDDVGTVLDAAGSERAAVMGLSEGGSTSVMFAANHPERVTALVLCNTCARVRPDIDYPAPSGHADFVDHLERSIADGWGTGLLAEYIVPSLAAHQATRDFVGRFERMSMSPGAASAVGAVNLAIDVRSVLPILNVPTLVIHRRDDRMVPVEYGRYLAAHIAGARLFEQDGADHVPWVGAGDEIVDEIQEFLTGRRSVPNADRILATVMFTDIVDSTSRAAELGDARWLELLDRHDALMRSEIERFRGREIKTTGDGFLAVFDGPARAVRCALAACEKADSLGLSLRAGIHTGECEQRADDVGGIAVHVGSRICSLALPNEVLASRTVTDLVTGSGLGFLDRGEHELKGVPGTSQLFAAHG